MFSYNEFNYNIIFRDNGYNTPHIWSNYFLLMNLTIALLVGSLKKPCISVTVSAPTAMLLTRAFLREILMPGEPRGTC